MLAFCPCLDISSIAPMELDLALAARRVVAYLSIPTEWLTLKAAVSMTTPLRMCAFPELASITPMKRYVLVFFYLQGGGFFISGTATLTNTNVYSNTADSVPAHLLNLPRRFFHCPTELVTPCSFVRRAK